MTAFRHSHTTPDLPLPILLLWTEGVWWVLAIDGGQARLFVRKGKRSEFAEMSNLIADEHGARIEPRNHGHHHGRYEQTERQFAQQVARRVETCAAREAFDHLALFAAPATLGVFRQAMGPKTLARLRHEEALDIVGEPTARILERFHA